MDGYGAELSEGVIQLDMDPRFKCWCLWYPDGCPYNPACRGRTKTEYHNSNNEVVDIAWEGFPDNEGEYWDKKISKPGEITCDVCGKKCKKRLKSMKKTSFPTFDTAQTLPLEESALRLVSTTFASMEVQDKAQRAYISRRDESGIPTPRGAREFYLKNEVNAFGVKPNGELLNGPFNYNSQQNIDNVVDVQHVYLVQSSSGQQALNQMTSRTVMETKDRFQMLQIPHAGYPMPAISESSPDSRGSLSPLPSYSGHSPINPSDYLFDHTRGEYRPGATQQPSSYGHKCKAVQTQPPQETTVNWTQDPKTGNWIIVPGPKSGPVGVVPTEQTAHNMPDTSHRVYTTEPKPQKGKASAAPVPQATRPAAKKSSRQRETPEERAERIRAEALVIDSGSSDGSRGKRRHKGSGTYG
ncbi:hypothetical protein QBC38DRAFT_461834 [Podospora fimiseda]|uniref:Uncharacterized protein n=1 Tax=Podospora fimiseda TaxID=252190 RepID=A0AAN6YQT6_9PEZI|nr:hypothetical protein QBC38DRAFT_461834 [Podospora fimiseda]